MNKKMAIICSIVFLLAASGFNGYLWGGSGLPTLEIAFGVLGTGAFLFLWHLAVMNAIYKEFVDE